MDTGFAHNRPLAHSHGIPQQDAGSIAAGEAGAEGKGGGAGAEWWV